MTSLDNKFVAYTPLFIWFEVFTAHTLMENTQTSMKSYTSSWHDNFIRTLFNFICTTTVLETFSYRALPTTITTYLAARQIPNSNQPIS